jgi:hypothetical protein
VCRPPKRCSRPLKKKKVKNIEIFSKKYWQIFFWLNIEHFSV